MSRHSDPRYFLLGSTPGNDDKIIAGSRLPTVRQVLFNFLAFHTSDSLTVREAAKITVSNVIPFYGRARVPHLVPHKMAEEVIKIYEDMRSLMKISPSRRYTGTAQKRIDGFKQKLEETMKMWPKNALDQMKNEEDKRFLLSMMTDRVASMGKVDKVLSTENKTAKRKEDERARLEKEKKRVEAEVKVSSENMEEDENSEINLNYDSDSGDTSPSVVMDPPKRLKIQV